MEMLLLNMIMLCFVMMMNNVISGENLAEILGGTGYSAVTTELSTLAADTVFTKYPTCLSCTGENPCAVEGECTAMHYLLDSTISPAITRGYCLVHEVCCHPVMCQLPVSTCTFDAASVLAKLQIDGSVLGALAAYTSDDLVTSMLADLNPMSALSKDCSRACNGWVGGVSDKKISDCPATCTCVPRTLPGISPGGDYVCENTQHVDGTAVVYYTSGDAKIDDAVVCTDGETCVDTNVCQSQEAYYRTQVPTQVPIKVSDTDVTDVDTGEVAGTGGLSTLSIVGIVVGSLAAVALIVGVALYLKKSGNPGDGYAAM